MFDPPNGTSDLEADCRETEGPYSHHLTVDGFEYLSRRPQPRSAHALSVAYNGKVGAPMQRDHLILFLRDNLVDGDVEQALVRMMSDQAPPDHLSSLAAAVCEVGTARPTRPSSGSRR